MAKKQMRLFLDTNKIEQNLPLIKALEENGFFYGNGLIEYDDEKDVELLKSIFDKYSGNAKQNEP